MNKKIIIGIVCVCIISILVILLLMHINKSNKKETNLTSQQGNTSTAQKKTNTPNEGKEKENMYSTGKHHAQIEVKDYGTIKLELDADIAPITVSNFAKLINENFYNGLTFHRIMSGFMIQGGDPLGNGTGGSKENIKGEFKANGVANTISHTRGVISMARAQSFNSASSQFFIVHEDSTFLDGQYAGFGKVTEGMEVVDKICENVKPVDDNGTVLKESQPTINKITMID